MLTTADATLTRDGYRWPTETVTAEVGPETLAGDVLGRGLVAAFEEPIRGALDVEPGDWVEIAVTECPEHPQLVGEAATWIV